MQCEVNEIAGIGFDLDHTLVKYNEESLVKLVNSCVEEILVNDYNFPPEIFDKEIDWKLLQKGIVLDGDNGNMVKLNEYEMVGKAYHGTKEMDEDEILKVYPERGWSKACYLIHNIVDKVMPENILVLVDYFTIGLADIFSKIVDYEILTHGELKTKNLCGILSDCLKKIFHHNDFYDDNHKFFSEIRANPDKYYRTSNAKTLRVLKTLKDAGKHLFVVTGSTFSFANFSASYVFGTDWMKYFTTITCKANKPIFFTNLRPFKNTDGTLLIRIKPDTVTTEGNWKTLHNLYKTVIPEEYPLFMYVGDNIIQDCCGSACWFHFAPILLEEEGKIDINPEYSNSVWGDYFENNYWVALKDKYCVGSISDLEDIVEQYNEEQAKNKKH